jgi:hypothetical protein
MNINMKYGVFAPITVLLALLAGCTGGSSDSDLVPSGATVTITGPIGDLTYLNHVPSLPDTTTVFYRSWAGIQSGMLMQYYLQGGFITSDYISISGTSDNSTKFWVGTSSLEIVCNVTIPTTPTAFPLCSSWGVTVDKTAGTLTFANTPVFNDANDAETGAMSGTLTFPPF